MSTVTNIAQRRGEPAPVPLVCAACTRGLGNAVAFCPFCGVAQAAAAVPPPLLPEPASAPHAPPAGTASGAIAVPAHLTGATLTGTRLTGTTPAGTPQAGGPASVLPLPPTPPMPQPGPARRFSWKRAALIAAAAVLGAAILRPKLAPGPRATLVVQVRSASGAVVTAGHILVDGKDVGVPGQSLTVAPGNLRVAFEEPGWRSDPRPVSVAKDASLTVSLTAQPLPARVSIVTSPPGATVRIQNRSYGRTPLQMNLDAGSYDLLLVLAGHVTKALPVVLGRGESRNLSADLQEVPAPAAPPPARFLPPPFDRGVLLAITPVQSGPARNADTVGTLPSLSEVQVQAQVATDETWLQVSANGRQGFVRAGTVEPWESWAQRNTASGPIDLVTTSLRVVIAGNSLPLSGIQNPERGPGPGLARTSLALGGMLRGMPARCVPRDTASFQCKTSDGRDVAELYLLNGGAVVGSGALPYYAEAQRTAREKQKGLWSD